MNQKQNTPPLPQEPRRIAAAIAKAVKAIDSVCWENRAQDYTGAARQELFDALDKLGYYITPEYKLVKKV